MAGVECQEDQGPVYSADYKIIKIVWSVDDDETNDGDFKFYSDGDQVGAISITDDKSGTTVSTGNIVLEANEQIQVRWSGSRIDDVILNVYVEEV